MLRKAIIVEPWGSAEHGLRNAAVEYGMEDF